MLKIIFPMDRNVGRTLFLSICGPENVPSECVSVYFSPLNSGNEEKNKTVKLGGPMRCSSKPTHPGFWCGQHVWHMMHSSRSTLLTLQGSLEVKTKQSWNSRNTFHGPVMMQPWRKILFSKVAEDGQHGNCIVSISNFCLPGIGKGVLDPSLKT